MLLRNTLIYLLLIATVNLIFCVPQQNDTAVAYLKETICTIENTDIAEGEIQSVFEIICEAVFDADIDLPIEKEASILEKDIIGKRINRTAFKVFIQFIVLNFLQKNLFLLNKPNQLICYLHNYLTSSAYSFIFRLTPF